MYELNYAKKNSFECTVIQTEKTFKGSLKKLKCTLKFHSPTIVVIPPMI